jgi:ABC-type transport system involved in multi-copper enzyme maturation permease subunit
MKAVLRWELSRRKAFMLWWTIGVSSLIAITVLAYKTLGDHIKELDSSFSGITSSAGSFFGGSDFFSPIGYLSSQIYYILLPLLLIIMIITLVSSLMLRDENDTTVELTLARAITRGRLLFAKAMAGIIVVIVVCTLSYFVTLIMVGIAGITINGWNLLLTHVMTFAFALSFGVISFVLIAASHLTRKFASIAAIVLSFGGYVVSSMAGYVSWLEQPAKFIPYHYFDTVALLNGNVSKGLLIYLVGTIVIGSFIAVIGYSRRDIG